MTHEIHPAIIAYLSRARLAQKEFATYSQERVDEVVAAVGWAIFREENARRLAEMEVEDSNMGRVEDKFYKNRFRVLGTLAEMRGQRSVGVIEHDEVKEITYIAKPKGVFAALVPSTNAAPGATQNCLALLKGRNAVIFSPQPRTKRTAIETCRLIRQALRQVGAPEDLVLILHNPTKILRNDLMRCVDVVLATGGRGLVQAAYSSGRPAIGVGPGNAVVVVDGTSDVAEACNKIAKGKCFDYATSCSSENSVVVSSRIYDAFVQCLRREGGLVLDEADKSRLQEVFWIDGKLNDKLICRSAQTIAKLANLSAACDAKTKFLVVEESGVGPASPFSGEKLAVILTLYKYQTFEEAVDLVQRIVAYQGAGHSCGIHSNDEANINRLAHEINVCRVLVNQVHAFGNSGNFDNGLAFTATLGCGSWGGNSIDENVTWKHCVNITRLSRPRARNVPDPEVVFTAHWKRHGRD